MNYKQELVLYFMLFFMLISLPFISVFIYFYGIFVELLINQNKYSQMNDYLIQFNHVDYLIELNGHVVKTSVLDNTNIKEKNIALLTLDIKQYELEHVFSILNNLMFHYKIQPSRVLILENKIKIKINYFWTVINLYENTMNNILDKISIY